jgi:hypothetical protein
MPSDNTYRLALEDAVRALRDIAALDPERPTKNDLEKVATRALERIGKAVGSNLTFEGHTPRPGETMFPPSSGAAVLRRGEGAPFYTGPIGVPVQRDEP